MVPVAVVVSESPARPPRRYLRPPHLLDPDRALVGPASAAVRRQGAVLLGRVVRERGPPHHRRVHPAAADEREDRHTGEGQDAHQTWNRV